MNPFDRIYLNNEWGCGSGEGSLPVHTSSYVRFLESFIRKNNIKSVVDAGCGDWQFSRLVDWGDTSYIGYDVVESVVREDTKKYASNRIKFIHYSGNPHELPSADLLICKDVLQHLPNASVSAFLGELNKYRCCLLTNCVNPRGVTVNQDISTGEFRYLDLRLPPFNLVARQVFTFQKNEHIWRRWFRPSWKKIVLLIGSEANNA